MKAYVCADLHCEFHADGGKTLIDELPAADVAVVAGDVAVASGLRPALKLLADKYPHVVYVAGNLPFEQWVEVCGSERLTGAMLDRLTHRVHIVEANGESYRLRDSQQRIRRKRTDREENRELRTDSRSEEETKDTTSS